MQISRAFLRISRAFLRIKVMSWNTWLGKNVDGLVKGIAKAEPDIIGLQEIVEGHSNTGGLNSAYLLQQKLKEKGLAYEVAYFPAFKSDRHITHHSIGEATLSRYPIINKKVYFLSDLEMYQNRGLTPARDAEPRICVETEIRVRERVLRVLNTHLGVSKDCEPTEFTKIQTQELLKIIGNGEGTILLGDFNVVPECETVREISRVLKNTDAEQKPTWPTVVEAARCHQERYGISESEPKLLTHRLDQILVGEGIRVVDFSLGESLTSDHKSLLATLEI